jgi:hypothetical protein
LRLPIVTGALGYRETLAVSLSRTLTESALGNGNIIRLRCGPHGRQARASGLDARAGRSVGSAARWTRIYYLCHVPDTWFVRHIFKWIYATPERICDLSLPTASKLSKTIV